jgi:hypothetical protein
MVYSTQVQGLRLNICSQQYTRLYNKAGVHHLGLHRCRDSGVEHLIRSTCTVRLDNSWEYTSGGTPGLNVCTSLHRSRIFKVEHLLLFAQEGWISLWSTQVQDLQGLTSVTVYTGRLYSSLVHTGAVTPELNICTSL